jgi:crotonobetainyl-CoA:carnitine CoA-transferase CaiB-like acyl-CoA transferase
MPFPRTSPRMHMLSISTASVVKRQEDEWRGELRARETSTKAPDTPRGPLMTRNAPARTCIMTATHKVQDRPLPAAIPGGFARSPASSRVATVRFAHPFAVVAAAFQTPES